MRSRVRSEFPVVLVAAVLAMRAVAVFPADCNSNGVPDDEDLIPRPIYSERLAGKTIWALVAGDFDGDGDADLAAADRSAGQVFLLSNDGPGRFSEALIAAEQALDLEAADLDGDGDLDLAFTRSEADEVVVVKNSGRGELAIAGRFAAGSAPSDMAMVDLDGDGDRDMMASNTLSNALSVLRNQGDGAFVKAHDILFDGSPISVATGDLDSDGDADGVVLLVGNLSNVTPLFNDGGGRLSPGAARALLGSEHLAAVDLDSDSDLDVVTVNYNLVWLYLLRNDGRGALGEPLVVEVPGRPEFVTGGDWNRDGILDLVTAGFHVQVLMGRGDLSFGRATVYRGPTLTVAPADYDGDGDLDLAGGGSDPRILFNHGEGRFGGIQWADPGARPTWVVAQDLDGDDGMDLSVVQPMYDQIAFLYAEDYGFAPSSSLPAGTSPRFLVAADVDVDGLPDIAVVNEDAEDVLVLRNAGQRSFLTRTTFHVGAKSAPLLADLDLDGAADFAAASELTVSVAWSSQDGTFEEPDKIPLGSNPAHVAAGDLDSDGKLDLATANVFGEDGTTADSVSVLLNQGNRAFRAPRNFAVERSPGGMVAGDVDGDGSLDLAVTYRERPEVTILLGDGRGGFPRKMSIPGELMGAVALGDADRDGDPDLAITAVAAISEEAFLLVNAGGGRFLPPRSYRVGLSPVSIAFADMGPRGGDGDNEIIVACNRGFVAIIDVAQAPASQDANHNAVPDECEAIHFHRGDPDADGKIDLADAVSILAHLFLGDGAPRCLEAADAGNDGVIDVSDPIQILRHLFLSGPPPASPGPPGEPCERDPDPPRSEGDLGCEEYGGC